MLTATHLLYNIRCHKWKENVALNPRTIRFSRQQFWRARCEVGCEFFSIFIKLFYITAHVMICICSYNIPLVGCRHILIENVLLKFTNITTWKKLLYWIARIHTKSHDENSIPPILWLYIIFPIRKSINRNRTKKIYISIVVL